MAPQTIAWIGFNLFVLLMLVLDLGVFNRKAHEISFKEALSWSGVWLLLALAFNAGIYFFRGEEAATAFLTGYLIEKSLSVDNIFVFLMIFTYFKVPLLYQHKVLYWGIIGALCMRAAFIFAGIALITRFHWIIYLFGAFLIYTGVQIVRDHGKEVHLERNPILIFLARFLPAVPYYENGKFFVRRQQKIFATPLFVALLVVEITDVIFAIDSIPAILAITEDPFIVYSSNACAILGLRSLYFAVSGMAKIFVYLHFGLAAILVFVGTKMLVSDIYKMPVELALGTVMCLLLASIVWSMVAQKHRSENSVK